ncbi:MAG: hypothetical protein U0324_42410 [Polyangiales bacterium]
MHALTHRSLRQDEFGTWTEHVATRDVVRVTRHGLTVDPATHEVTADGGWVTLEGRGRTEEHGLRAFDRVFADDGVGVYPGRLLFERPTLLAPCVATHPAGETAVVRFRGLVRDHTLLTQMSQHTFLTRRVVRLPRDPHVERPRLELTPIAPDARWAPVELPLPDGAELRVADGDTVARGALLAIAPARLRPAPVEARGDARLHDLFEGRRRHPHRAVLAPVSGCVTREGVAPGRLAIVHDGGRTVVKLPRRPRALLTFDGMRVEAGDPLTDGAIDHRDLAPIVGRRAFLEHLCDELDELFSLEGANVPGPYAELAAKALLRGDDFVGVRRGKRPR